MSPLAHLGYALAWLSFGLLHSLLAHPPVQRRLGRRLGAGTRLAYNLFAAAHLLAVWLVGQALGAGARPLALAQAVSLAQWGVLAAGLLLGLAALAGYDLARFGGTWQLRAGAAPGDAREHEPLVSGGLNRFVRHPLYAALLLIVWGLARDELALATAVWITLYLAIGIRLEERKLLSLYGEAYRDYRRQVPALLPWRGRAWPPRG